MALDVDIVGPDRVLFSGEAEFVSAPCVEGSIGLYAGHEPFLAVLRAGEVGVVALDGERTEVAVGGGFISFDHDRVTVVADPAGAGA